MFFYVRVVFVIVIALHSEGKHATVCRPGHCKHTEGGKEALCKTEGCKQTAKRINDYMDLAVRPCDNFYKFACGKFLDTAENQDFRRENSSITQTDGKVQEQLKTIVLEKSSRDEPLPYQNVKLLFSQCMDEDKINARGVGHVLALLQKAGGWPVLGCRKDKGWNFLDTEILLRYLAISGESLFKIAPFLDPKMTSRYVLMIDQPELVLNRVILIEGMGDPRVQAYYSFMVDIAVMFGADRRTAKYQLKESLLFEIELAKITVPVEVLLDPEHLGKLYEVSQLMAEVPDIDWAWLLSSMMPKPIFLRKDNLIYVNEMGFLKKLEKLLRSFRSEVITNYMMWNAVFKLLGTLPNDFRNRHFEFLKIVEAKENMTPRWKECIKMVRSLLGLALSSMYVKKFTDETLKKEALDMTEKIKQQMIYNIHEIDWMDKETRKQAAHKASQVTLLVAYQDELLDIRKLEHFYKGMVLNKEFYFESVINIKKWIAAFSVCLLREPVNKTDWRLFGELMMNVNAFYIYNSNAIKLPAGILQSPFFNAHVPKYINYASIGFTVGHEVTHGFDDKGSQFDYKGDLKAWWDIKSKENFIEKKQCIIDQYAGFKDNLTHLNLNGVNIQSENIADNGGLKLAYWAYQQLANKLNKPEPLLPGLQNFNQNQLFFLSFANTFCSKLSPKSMAFHMTVHIHPPWELRVNGALKNFPQFSEVFQCSVNDPMNPMKKCAVW